MINRKHTAIFMIYLIIALSFAIYKIPEVQAQQQACCQFTTDNEACVYTDVSRCDKGLKSFTACANTDYCKLGCCIDENLGVCSIGVGKSQCIKQGGSWQEDPTCSIPQCQPGCCKLGTECFFTTQRKCVVTASQFPGLQPIFDENIQTEQACINSCKSLEKGACVFEDKSCKLTTRAGCTGTFNANLLCSNAKLNTVCAPQQSKNCLKEDVYWFDSCGNPENPYHSNKELSYNNGIIIPENKIDQKYGIANVNDKNNGNCDYPQKNICGKVNNNYMCVSIDCANTEKYENLDYTGGEKQSGESWCLYESAIGFGYDLIGSRHFRAVCVNGEEIIEPCEDYRMEFCIQNKDIDGKLLSKQQFLNLGKDYSEAMCRPNRYDECSKCNDPTLPCGGECNKYSGKQRQACCMMKACDDITKRDCYWQQGQNEWGGICVPLVSPGLKFWDASASEDYCAKANQQCDVYFYSKALSDRIGKSEREWDIVGSKECTTEDWALAGNTICKSQGDCGAWYNTQGEFSAEGFSSKDVKIGKKDYSYDITSSDVDSFALAKNPKAKRYKKTSEFFKKSWFALANIVAVSTVWGVAGSSWTMFGLALSPVYGTILEGAGESFTSEALISEVASTWTGMIESIITKDMIKQNIEQSVVDELLKEGISQKALDEAGIKAGEKISEKTIENLANNQALVDTSGGFWGTVLPIINFLMWIYLAYQIIDVLGAKDKKITFETYCKPWEAPDGGKDCEECNDFLGGCSEYRCRSLGKSCQLINQGTEKEKCVSVSQYDTKAPKIIKPAIGLGYTIQEKIKPFTKVELNLETDEPAQCKFSTEPNKDFDKMEFNFGSSAYIYEHELIFSLPSNMTQPEVLEITNNGKYTLYIKCKDSNGNDNKRDYYYKFEIDKSPDLTAPKIEAVTPIGPYIKSDINQIPVSIMVSEPADCKWSTIIKPFEQMQNEFLCTQDPFDYTNVYYGLYECNSILDITQSINNYFFKCRDISGNKNKMAQAYKYTLKSTNPLQITSIEPKGESHELNPIIKVTTSSGAENGIAVCGYSETPNLPIQEIARFQTTNSSTHEQPLLGLQAKQYTYFITCIDIAGNSATEELTFKVTVDIFPPKITQIYIDQNTNILHIITSEQADCEYAHTSFSFGSGISMTGNIDHQASIDEQERIYYIKCQDENDNIMSSTIYP